MKRLREWIESIVFAGMKPAGQKVGAKPVATTWFGRLRERIDNMISGGPAPSDPLYLTNRTTTQKMKSWSVVALPLLILIGGVGLTLSHYLAPPEKAPEKELTAAEVAKKVLPPMDLKVTTNRDVDVLDMHILHSGGTHLLGRVKNTTTHEIAVAELNCDLTDGSGTTVGAVSATVERIPASSEKNFDLLIKQDKAAFVLIREVISR